MTDSNVRFFDDEEEPDAALRSVTNLVIGAGIEVHKRLGPGYGEGIYQRALAAELRFRQIAFQEQVPVSISYRGEIVGEQRLDFVVCGQVVIELKAVDAISPLHVAQVVSYLKSTGMPLGLLINFNVRLLKDGIRRVANTYSSVSSRRPPRSPDLGGAFPQGPIEAP